MSNQDIIFFPVWNNFSLSEDLSPIEYTAHGLSQNNLGLANVYLTSCNGAFYTLMSSKKHLALSMTNCVSLPVQSLLVLENATFLLTDTSNPEGNSRIQNSSSVPMVQNKNMSIQHKMEHKTNLHGSGPL